MALIEPILTAGSSRHAADSFHAINAKPNMAILRADTIDLLRQVEAESGQSIGVCMTGGIQVASAPDRWEWLQALRFEKSFGIRSAEFTQDPTPRVAGMDRRIAPNACEPRA